MRLLDIVITHYKEKWSVGKKLFEMIGLQRCIDFSTIKVTVVNDGGNRLPDEELTGFPYEIEQVDIPHGGVSAARNAGLDHAEAPWIMFCDFDDNFASVFSLREYLNVLPNDQMDMLWCKILAEDYMDGKQKLYFVPDKQRFVFCHGKIYRRQFLIDKSIRFDEELVFNEDSCFNAVIIARTHYSRIGEIRTTIPLYAWIRRESSVTNSGREDEATYGHFRRNMKVTAEYENGDERYPGMVTRTVYDTYYMVFGKRNSTKMRRRLLDEFIPWISERIDAFGKVDKWMIEEIRKVSRSELVEPDENISDDFITIANWVYQLVDVYKKVG